MRPHVAHWIGPQLPVPHDKGAVSVVETLQTQLQMIMHLTSMQAQRQHADEDEISS
jgi:hypothetical protein